MFIMPDKLLKCHPFVSKPSFAVSKEDNEDSDDIDDDGSEMEVQMMRMKVCQLTRRKRHS